MATRRKSPSAQKSGKVLPHRTRLTTDEVRDLSAAERRELEHAIKDLEDRTRYLLASPLGERITLYYNIADDTFSWDDPKGATLFKRKVAAQKIRAILGSGVKVLSCRVDKRGHLLTKSIQPPP